MAHGPKHPRERRGLPDLGTCRALGLGSGGHPVPPWTSVISKESWREFSDAPSPLGAHVSESEGFGWVCSALWSWDGATASLPPSWHPERHERTSHSPSGLSVPSRGEEGASSCFHHLHHFRHVAQGVEHTHIAT